MAESWSLGQKYERPRHKGLKTLAILTALMAITILPALAAKGGAGGGGKGHGGSTGGSTGGTGSLTLRVLTGPDNVPNWGEQVTFDVSTTATTEPHVSLKCYQGAQNLVLTTQTGYYASYPWPWTQTMTLSTAAWTGGGADCTAVLYYFSGTNTINLGSLNFAVGA